MLDGMDQAQLLLCLFKQQLLTRLFHFPMQGIQHILDISPHEFLNTADHVRIHTLINFLDAGRQTLSHVIVQAFLFLHPPAFAQRIDAIQQLCRFPCRAGIRKRPEIIGLAILRIAHHLQYRGIFLCEL